MDKSLSLDIRETVPAFWGVQKMPNPPVSWVELYC